MLCRTSPGSVTGDSIYYPGGSTHRGEHYESTSQRARKWDEGWVHYALGYRIRAKDRYGPVGCGPVLGLCGRFQGVPPSLKTATTTTTSSLMFTHITTATVILNIDGINFLAKQQRLGQGRIDFLQQID